MLAIAVWGRALVAAAVLLGQLGGMPRAAAEPSAGDYIVVMRRAVDAETFALLVDGRDGVEVQRVFPASLNGFHAELSRAAHASLSRDPGVLFVSPNRRFTATAQLLPTGVDRIDADLSSVLTTGSSVGTAVAVLDSGIAPVGDLNVQPGVNCTATAGTTDRHGHGTHVAGIIAAKDNAEGVIGVAPGAPLYPVKVLDDRGAGSDATILCGIEWLTTVGRLLDIRVANMSLSTEGFDDGNCGLTQKDALHLAICRTTDAGTLVVASAGNTGGSTRYTVPAAYDEVLTVTWMNDYDGTTSTAPTPSSCTQFGPDDTYSNYSNYASGAGDEVHTVAAPGSCISSTAVDGGTRIASGSSMAAPHVAGAIAMCLHVGTCAGTPEQVMHHVRATAEARPATYGFAGDPTRPRASNVYYGYLAYAGGD